MNICISCKSSFEIRNDQSHKEILMCWPDGDSSKEQLAQPCDKFSRDGIVPAAIQEWQAFGSDVSA